MPRIGGVNLTDEAARDVMREVERALLEGAPADTIHRVISLHVNARGEQLPRIPVIGLEAGAIRGTRPDTARLPSVRDPR